MNTNFEYLLWNHKKNEKLNVEMNKIAIFSSAEDMRMINEFILMTNANSQCIRKYEM